MKTLIVVLLLLSPVAGWGAGSVKKKVKPPVVSPPVVESSRWNEKMCPQGIAKSVNLININPYDTEGKCFEFQGRLFQLLSKSKALFAFWNGETPFALVDVGNSSVPMTYFNDIVIGKGAFSYQTVAGEHKIIHSFAVVPKSAGRIAWEEREKREQEDRQQAEEQRKNTEAQMKAIEESERARALEKQEQADLIAEPLLCIDRRKGLMWPKNGNIAGLGMNWEKAQNWVKNLSYAGYQGWRMPTWDELMSFSKPGRGKLESQGIKNIVDSYYAGSGRSIYWSSADGKVLEPYIVEISAGGNTGGRAHIGGMLDPENHVWPVRDINKW